jgi:hypothetical protein
LLKFAHLTYRVEVSIAGVAAPIMIPLFLLDHWLACRLVPLLRGFSIGKDDAIHFFVSDLATAV